MLWSSVSSRLVHSQTSSRPLFQCWRHQSTARSFYQNRQLELYASREAKRFTLRQLVFFGRSMNEERLIQSANFVRTELPVRIAHRLRDLQALQYRIVTNEGVAKVYEMYWDAFERFRRYPVVTSLSENAAFCAFLRKILGEHATVIPNLSLGISLSSRFLPPEQLDSLMRRMLVSRISRRVLAEHHIALSEIHGGERPAISNGVPHVGIISTRLDVKGSVEKCSNLLRERPPSIESEDLPPDQTWPDVLVNGHLLTKLSYIKEHLEYIIFELLKNSMRATLLRHSRHSSLPPIHVTIAEGTNDVTIRISDEGGGLKSAENQITSPADLFSFSHIRNASRLELSRLGALRSMSSSREGITATVDEQLTRWHKADQGNPESDAGVGPHPRYGIGLPMSKIFATYFGGTLELVSMDGWGTDVYLSLPKLGTNLEGVEL